MDWLVPGPQKTKTKQKTTRRTMGPISEHDQAVVTALKSEGVFLKFDFKDLNGSTRNGGVGIPCGDGDTDIHKSQALISHRPHCLRVFGGALVFAPSYRGYDADFAAMLVKNLKAGMEAKDTKSLFLYFHAPCGMATKHKHSIREQIALAVEARDFFIRDPFFVPEKIHILFHTKKLVVDATGQKVLEQNTYKIVI